MSSPDEHPADPRGPGGHRGAHELLGGARLLALDVDGVLTDGRVVYCDGREVQSFSVQDGQGLVWLARAGIEIAWISGRGSRATRRRAAELGVREVHLRVGPKARVLAALQERLQVPPEATVAMGDDLPDLGLASRAALFACPADARPEVRARAGWVARSPGGRGAVRELAEAVLAARGLWEEHLARYARGAE